MEQENVNQEVAEEAVATGTEDTTSKGQYDDLTREEAIERLSKAEAAIVKSKEKAKEKVEAEPTPAPKAETVTNPNSDARIDRIELRQKGYPEEIVEHIMELGGPNALKNPIVKKSADDMLAQAKAEQASAVDGSTQQAPVTKYSQEDLANMSVEEMEKVLPHAD